MSQRARDPQNAWESELGREQAPETLAGQTLDLGPALQGAAAAIATTTTRSTPRRIRR